MEEAILQTVLGTDIRNPVLSLCREKDTDKQYVYFGAQLLEVVPDNPDHISFKALVGRLFNAGSNRKGTPTFQSQESSSPKYLHYAGLFLFSNFILLLSTKS